jgi:hypothetical protein
MLAIFVPGQPAMQHVIALDPGVLRYHSSLQREVIHFESPDHGIAPLGIFLSCMVARDL